MSTQRATGEEQRAQRRRRILDATERMLADTPVARLGINEIARHVGLAASNVLRYFESREAILLELLDEQQRGWAAELDGRIAPSQDPGVAGRARTLASALAGSLDARPVLCELLAARPAVLERDVSVHVLLRHRYAAADAEDALVPVVRRLLPELDPAAAHRLVTLTVLAVAAVLPQSRPSRSLRAVYEADPQLARRQRSFGEELGEIVELTALGLLVR